MSFVLFYFAGKLDVVILIDFIVKESTVQPTCSHGRRFIPRESTQPVVPEQHQEAGLQEMEHIFLFHVYICIYFMLQVFCFCNGILAVPDVDISLCRRFAVLILTLLPPKSGLDCSFFFNGFGIWSGLFWRAGFVFVSIPTLKSESQPLYGNTVWDRKQRKHKKKQNQTNKM